MNTDMPGRAERIDFDNRITTAGADGHTDRKRIRKEKIITAEITEIAIRIDCTHSIMIHYERSTKHCIYGNVRIKCCSRVSNIIRTGCNSITDSLEFRMIRNIYESTLGAKRREPTCISPIL